MQVTGVRWTCKERVTEKTWVSRGLVGMNKLLGYHGPSFHSQGFDRGIHELRRVSDQGSDEQCAAADGGVPWIEKQKTLGQDRD